MVQLEKENESLNQIISALNLKLKKTEDLELELKSMRQALRQNETAREELRTAIEDQTHTLDEHQAKSEKFQTLIIEENRNLKQIILEKDQQIIS